MRLTILEIYFEQLLQFSQCTGWVGSGQRSVKNIYFYVSYNVLVWWVSNLDILQNDHRACSNGLFGPIPRVHIHYFRLGGGGIRISRIVHMLQIRLILGILGEEPCKEAQCFLCAETLVSRLFSSQRTPLSTPVQLLPLSEDIFYKSSLISVYCSAV